MMKSKYMVISYVKKPKDPKMTKNKGYLDNEKNIRWDECVTFTTSLSNKNLTESWIVIDLIASKVIKARMHDEHTFNDIIDYYANIYEKQIQKFLKTGIDR